MEKGTRRQVIFISRSLIWSLLLYVALMLVINREEISNTAMQAAIISKPHTDRPHALEPVQAQPNISTGSRVAGTVAILLEILSGIAASRH